MQKNLEVLHQDDKLFVLRLSYRKILVEYSVPVYLSGSNEPLEYVRVKLKYQLEPEFIDKENKAILPAKELRCSFKEKSWDTPMRSINGRWGIKRNTITCETTHNYTISLQNVDYVLNFFPTHYQILTEESYNRVKTKLRELHLSRILI